MSLQFPLRHISIRVPWHDAGWNGSVCKCPARNTACLKLANITEKKNEQAEEALKTKSIRDLDQKSFPACVSERATFMADFAFSRLHEHPYVKTSPETHAHFKPTPLHYPAYAAPALPFRWLMKPVVFGDPKQNERGFVNDFPLADVDPSKEPELPFETQWFQDYRNHRALLDCFWGHVRREDSLVFFYAKQVPLVEDTGRRILIGVGRVTDYGDLTEYRYEGSPDGKIRSLLWERMVHHTIRPDFKDGFLLPYQEALEKSDEGRKFDPAEVVAFAPEDRFTEFSFATEHVSNDAAISALLACRSALLRAAQLFNHQTHRQEQWIDLQLGRLWKKRGAFPGLGAVLTATGVPMGHFIAQALTEKVGEDDNPWEAWSAAIAAPDEHLPKELARHIDATIAKSWQKLPPQRRAFLQLLSRIDLTAGQASFIAIPEERAGLGVTLADDAFLANPYLIFEATRLTALPISVGAVDRGMLPAAFVRERHPIPVPSTVKTAVDSRRLRALVIRELEDASQLGHTLRPKADIITSIRSREESFEEQRTTATADLLAVAEEEHFAGEIRLVPMSDGSGAYQLERFATVGDLIRTTVTKRIEPPRHNLTVNWRTELDQLLEQERKRKGLPPPSDPVEIEKEERARQEKAAALHEIASSRFSILIGPAGTGKTTLLSVLCQRPEIHKEGILLLAPTGKARVRMEEIAKQAGTQNFQALTIAQFLSRSEPKRYDGATQRYRLTGQSGEKVARTVIVDECSMLTEEMMAALIESLSGVHRLIFVGDPRQLPPIGAGRPFADIVARLRPQAVEQLFPRVSPAYAELTIPRRQGAGDREDLQLAAWFGGATTGPGEDQVFEILAGHRTSATVRFVPWSTPDELDKLIPNVLAETLGFDPKLTEWQAFACSLGGQLFGNYVYFNRGRSGQKAEAWQILSPVRQQPWGVATINRQIHLRHKAQQVEVAMADVPPWKRRLLRPCGDQQIVYGDKVINNRNWSVPKGRIYPQPKDRGYLANGEIGTVVGQIRTKNFDYEPTALEIEFSTQQNTTFKFYPSDFDDDGEADLELAYALTIHKAQGSEFETVFLILPRSPLMLTRELLYTALTRQKQKVVIFHQGSATDLQRLSSERCSSTAGRLTNLFGAPKPVAIGDKFLEDRLIHRTNRGEAVRSKSEVIIANELHHRKLDYHYEQPLTLDGVVKYPDFTIEDDNTGKTYYWEHCGLLHDPAYASRWKEKKQWYLAHGIVPLKEGGGPSGTLIETRDEPDGGINCQSITTLLNDIFG